MPLDQQINGVTDMMYINAVSADDGTANITVTFELERDPDLAAVEVQNRVSQAQSQLPHGSHHPRRDGAQAVAGHADVHRSSIRRMALMTGCSSTTMRTSTSSTN